MSKVINFLADSFLKLPAELTLTQQGFFTLELWAKLAPEQESDKLWLLHKANQQKIQYGLQIILENNIAKLQGYYGENGVISETLTVDSQQWHHYVLQVSYDEATQQSMANLYVDGLLIETTSALGEPGKTPNVSEPLVIGEDFIGQIAEVRVWNEARSESHIRSNRVHPLTGYESGLLAYLPLHQGHEYLVEKVNNTREIAAFNINSLTEAFPIHLATEPCVQFDRPKHYGLLPEITNFPDTRFTFETWVKTTNSSDSCVLFEYRGAEESQPTVTMGNAHRLTVTILGESIFHSDGSTQTVKVDDGVWHHLTVSWDALTGLLLIYVDGLVAIKNTVARGKLLPQKGMLTIGQATNIVNPQSPDQTPSAFNGLFADIRLWDTVRNQQGIINDRFYRLTGKEVGLIAYWPLNDGQGNQAKDSNSNRPALSLIGADLWIAADLWIKSSLIKQLYELRDKQLNDDCYDLKEKIKQLEAEIARLKQTQPTEISVEALINNISEQVAEARKAAKQNREYYLGKVTMNIKAVPVVGDTDQKVILPNKEDLKNMCDGVLSDISIELNPQYTLR
ncbi:LamG domain-containing protein [Endozoicomonas sp. SM1973]|uniref:LamG domain-containing protein n=1 Tax=Spartinivicinus marinus TaxID=2994442 RepID=A0A853IGP2_9GAMM|nr:LamG domain-containing protein [Spartinivicinus marinus]MCX4029612.1 LamG domain-containing protein [Spartinivicinus marinus]NYZ69171.1 LamG domain-containing protein [Spartinivicinus marinus]